MPRASFDIPKPTSGWDAPDELSLFEVSNATGFESERFETEARPVDPENGRSVTSPICWGKKKLEP